MIAPKVPPADETTAPWWEATAEHRLLVQSCGNCGSTQHPPRGVCTNCGNTERLSWVTSGQSGTVDSFTIVHRGPRPDMEVPYVIARVRLDEGVVLLTRLEGQDPDEWDIDVRVRTSWVDLPDGRALPVFIPASH